MSPDSPLPRPCLDPLHHTSTYDTLWPSVHRTARRRMAALWATDKVTWLQDTLARGQRKAESLRHWGVRIGPLSLACNRSQGQLAQVSVFIGLARRQTGNRALPPQPLHNSPPTAGSLPDLTPQAEQIVCMVAPRIPPLVVPSPSSAPPSLPSFPYPLPLPLLYPFRTPCCASKRRPVPGFFTSRPQLPQGAWTSHAPQSPLLPRSTLPPQRITPTLQPGGRGSFEERAAASPTAPLGSTTT